LKKLQEELRDEVMRTHLKKTVEQAPMPAYGRRARRVLREEPSQQGF